MKDIVSFYGTVPKSRIREVHRRLCTVTRVNELSNVLAVYDWPATGEKATQQKDQQ